MFELKLDFIENILRKFHNDFSIIVKEISIAPACEKGENFMSIVRKLTVQCTKHDKKELLDFTSNLIVKRPFDTEVLEQEFNHRQIFMNEVNAYNQTIPSLRQHYKLTLPVAQCLYADEQCIILNDFTVNGYIMRSHEMYMSFEQSVAVLQELATLHGASIVLKELDPKHIDYLAKQTMEIYRPNNVTILDSVEKSLTVAIMLLKSLEKTSEKIDSAIKTMENFKDEIYQRVCSLFNRKCKMAVLNHGDCWRNNILFKITNSGIKVKLIDLQMMRRSSIAADLNYFLYINLSTEDRNRNINLLLDAYIQALRRNVTEHGLNMEEMNYTREWLEQEMADFTVFGFMCSLWIAPVFYYDKEALPDVENLKPNEVNAGFNQEFIMKHMTPDLKNRIISLVLDFVHNYKF